MEQPIKTGVPVVGAAGFEPDGTQTEERGENIGIPGHPQASLIPFKKGKSPIPRRDRSASLGPLEPGDESHTSNAVEVPLSKGGFALVDADDLDRVAQHSWHLTSEGYAAARIDSELVYLHRFIMHTQAGVEVDHVSRDKLDNRKSNLRHVTRSQNNWNRAKGKGTSSTFRGVHQAQASGKWIAQVRIEGKSTHLGVFESEVEAAKAYDAAAFELYRDFSGLNFPAERKNRLMGELCQLADALTAEGLQSVVNHARGWYIGLLPNKDRRTA